MDISQEVIAQYNKLSADLVRLSNPDSERAIAIRRNLCVLEKMYPQLERIRIAQMSKALLGKDYDD